MTLSATEVDIEVLTADVLSGRSSMTVSRAVDPRPGWTPGGWALRLLQWRGGVELPADGRWELARGSRVIVGRGRGRVALSSVEGDLDIDHGDCRLRLAGVIDAAHRLFELTSERVDVEPGDFDIATWHVSAGIFGAGAVAPVLLTLSYHGVFRLGTNAWVHLSGHGISAGASSRRRCAGTTAVEIDALFGPRRSRSVRQEGDW